jgi:hypothetical protein
MWSYYSAPWPKDLEELLEPGYGSRGLDVGGFALADPFDTLLRSLSEDYLQAAWLRLDSALKRYQLRPGDISWGYFYRSDLRLPGAVLDLPSDYFGWSSKELENFDADSRFGQIDEDLAQGSPSMRCVVTWKSVKWRIPPDDYAMGLRIVELISGLEPTDWAPDVVLQPGRDVTEPWVKVAQAIRDDDQQELDRALAEVKEAYTPTGYRMVVRGYGTYVYRDDSLHVRLPVEELP